MTDLLTDLGKVAGVLAFLGYIPYLMSIVRRKTLPNPATWWIWSIMGGILLASYYVAGNREAIWVPVSYFIGPTVTAILSIKYGRNEFGSFERYCLGGAAVSLLLWWVSGPIVALTMLIMIDLIAIAPTLRKTYFKPTSEDPLAWIVFWLANTINLYVVLASESPTYATIAYPFELFLLPTSIMCLVIRGSIVNATKKSPRKMYAYAAETSLLEQAAAPVAKQTKHYNQVAEFNTLETGDSFNEELATAVRRSARKMIANTVAEELSDLMNQYAEQPAASTISQTVPSSSATQDSPDASPTAYKGSNYLSEKLIELLGIKTAELSPSETEQLKVKWREAYQEWTQRSLEYKRCAYLWMNSVCINKNATASQRIFFAIGVNSDGYRELLGIAIGKQLETSWKSLLLDLKRRGLQEGIQLAVSSDSSEIWDAFSQVFPTVRQQQCWDSKIADVLKKLPKKLHVKAKDELWEIYRAETKEDANQMLDSFVKTYQVKYYEAADCLANDRDKLLSFYSFPAEHWRYLYSTKLTSLDFENALSTVKEPIDENHKDPILYLVLQVAKKAQKKWPRVKGFRYLGDVIEGTSFHDGVPAKDDTDKLVDSLAAS